jgi:hypothetical protein
VFFTRTTDLVQRLQAAREVAVNVSAKNLRDVQLPDRLARHCEKFGISPDSVTLELTETSAMRDPVQMIEPGWKDDRPGFIKKNPARRQRAGSDQNLNACCRHRRSGRRTNS